MTAQNNFSISQDYKVLPLKARHAYPVLCDEWDYIREKLAKLDPEPWLLHTVGSLLAGAGLSVLITILQGTYDDPAKPAAAPAAWAIFAVCAICGGVCLYMAHEQRKVGRERASDLVAQMRLIEQRYEGPIDTGAGP